VLLDPQNQQLRFCSAGHLPFLRWRAGQIAEFGREGDPPLGILREHQFTEQILPLQQGDVFVLLTDGITEARNDSAQEFGLWRVRELLAAHAESGAQAIGSAIVSAVQAHQASSTGRDDQTLIVLQVCWH
jgi:sigma-B regulation protein RsbU (phosphoserine phosphatase)